MHPPLSFAPWTPLPPAGLYQGAGEVCERKRGQWEARERGRRRWPALSGIVGLRMAADEKKIHVRGTVANLHELTERIAHLLHMGCMESQLHCPKDAPVEQVNNTCNVAVVFGKHLVREQMTVEYAKRIVTLAKSIAEGTIYPHVICFTGGKVGKGSLVSEAAAGYLFFRSICEEIGLSVDRFEFVLEELSHNTKENLANVVSELKRRRGADILSKCHFILVSSDYHLIRMQEVHRLSPRQSLLFPLQIVSATWKCLFAAYPFCVSRDPATAFLGRIMVLANDLGIVLVNLNGVVDDRQFLARENLHRLSETFAKMRDMSRVIQANPSAEGGFSTDMRNYWETLEQAIHRVREVQTLLSPLKDHEESIPRTDLERARQLLVSAVVDMRSTMDPDRPLCSADYTAIIENLSALVHSDNAQSNIDDSPQITGFTGDTDNSSIKNGGAEAVSRNGKGKTTDAGNSVQGQHESSTASDNEATKRRQIPTDRQARAQPKVRCRQRRRQQRKPSRTWSN